MNLEAIFHQAHGAYAYAISEHEARITLRAKKGDLISCQIVHEDRYQAEGTFASQDMVLMGSDLLFDYFQASIVSQTRRIRYKFLLEDGVHHQWFGEDGFAQSSQAVSWFQLPYLLTADLFQIPSWVDEAVVYQVFPDRFYNGDASNDPDGTRPWGEKPETDSFFGGDLRGIIEKIPYLRDVGITLLYMTPIFESPSTHKYDTTDYLRVDSMFGDEDTLKELVQQAHDAGIRVMLDAVFNHSGAGFAPFQDVLLHGEESQYANWFHIHEFPVSMSPVNYDTFANQIATMPKLRTEHPAVQKYLLEAAEYWIREVGIDGWRLDVANEVDHRFWRKFRDVVRQANPEALIIGEVWHDSPDWLLGDQFDGVMNYLFRDASVDFFAKRTIDVTEFDARLTRTRMMYREQAILSSFNLLGSHDTHRFLTLCHENLDQMKLAVTFQMMYIGIPEIYYGDEIGMVGENDPDCRRTMDWTICFEEMDLWKLHQQLILIRKSHPAIQKGIFKSILLNPITNVYGFVREWQLEKILIYLNNGKHKQTVQLPDRQAGTELLSNRDIRDEFQLEAYEAAIILLE